MNDLAEMRAGIFLGAQLFPAFANAAANTPDRATILIQAFNHYLAYLQNESVLDTYIFCLCKQKDGDTDGILSMWREYGSRGNGAALVFNAMRVSFNPTSPLLIAEVTYAKGQEREQQLKEHLNVWAQITIGLNLPNDHLYIAAYAAFLFIKLVALTTKHEGFEEEKEVRVMYIPEQDPRGYLKPHLGYHIGIRGVEPKLKYKFEQTMRTTDGQEPVGEYQTGSLNDLIEFIVLGPTVSSPLAKAAFIRMLTSIHMEQFADRVYPSTIPLRPTSH